MIYITIVSTLDYARKAYTISVKNFYNYFIMARKISIFTFPTNLDVFSRPTHIFALLYSLKYNGQLCTMNTQQNGFTFP